MSETDGEKSFRVAIENFDNDLELTSRLSHETNGRFVKTRFGWASYLFSRLVTVGMSIGRLLVDYRREADVFALDHASIMALARNIVEAALMFSYLAEQGLDEDTWHLRKNVLWLHDATSRYKMFKAFENDREARVFKKHRDDIKAAVGAMPNFQKLPIEERDKILAGHQMYVGGLRGAARSAGWDPKQFDGIYMYLSQQGHSGPMSFLRTEEHLINYLRPSDAQLGFSAFALEVVCQALTSSSRRMVELFPDAVEDHGFEDLRPEPESPYAVERPDQKPRD